LVIRSGCELLELIYWASEPVDRTEENFEARLAITFSVLSGFTGVFKYLEINSRLLTPLRPWFAQIKLTKSSKLT